MNELTKEIKHSIATSAAQELIKIEVHKLRNINGLSSYKNRIIKALEQIFDFFDLEDNSVLYTIYEHEENNLNNNIKYEKEIGILNNNKEYIYNGIQYSAECFIKLFEFTGNSIYTICQSYLNEKYPLYELEDIFWEITFDFGKEMDLPVKKISSMYNHFGTKETEFKRSLFMLYQLSGYNWFEKSKETERKYGLSDPDNKKDLVQFLNQDKEEETKISKQAIENKRFMERMAKKLNRPEFKKGAELKQQIVRIKQLLNENAHLNDKNGFFHSLNHVGFESLKNKKYIYGRDRKEFSLLDKEISRVLTNKQILHILEFFPELGITGILTESNVKYKETDTPQKYKDKEGNFYFCQSEFGEPEFSNISIQVAKKAKWNNKHDKLLKELLTMFHVEHHLEFNNQTPKINL